MNQTTNTETTETTETTVKYTFAVRGPSQDGVESWRIQDVTDALWGAHSPEPMTMAEIEELVAVFDECSSIAWDGLVGEYAMPTEPNTDELGIYTITLEVAA